MKRWLQITLCLLASLHLVGGHWGVLQTVAWFQMIRDYSQDKGIALAVKETFDGEHPCAMCLKISADKQKESREALPAQNKTEKPTTWLAVCPGTAVPMAGWLERAAALSFVAVPVSFAQWGTEPPTPPPRSGAV